MTAATAVRLETGHGVAVEFDELHRWYGSVHALDGLTIDIAPGELIALLGPSGCGKTTALRALGGLDEVDQGRILVGGKDITNVPANKRNMGIVFQAYSLFPNMTARDNVAYGLRLRGLDGAARKKKAEEMLELVGLGQQASRYPHQMSGGQQQRVALARALAIEPSVLLLDEPLSALDAKVRRQLREEIRRIQIMIGITTLFVTHDQEEALAMGDRVGVMSAGRLEQIAAPAELYDRPKTRFVAEFVGLTNRDPRDRAAERRRRAARDARAAARWLGRVRPGPGPRPAGVRSASSRTRRATPTSSRSASSGRSAGPRSRCRTERSSSASCRRPRRRAWRRALPSG